MGVVKLNKQETGLSNEELLKKLKEYQESKVVHDLTCCSADGCKNQGMQEDRTLIPTLSDDGNVILKCPCGVYTQDSIPEIVLKI